MVCTRNHFTHCNYVHIFYFFAFTAIIYCTFDKDYCHWDRNPRNINATQYGFDRHTASDLESGTIPGPPYDAFESKDGTFVIASNMISKDAAKNTIGKLFSPYLLGTQHPVECFSFYVYFSVSYLLQITIVTYVAVILYMIMVILLI